MQSKVEENKARNKGNRKYQTGVLKRSPGLESVENSPQKKPN